MGFIVMGAMFASERTRGVITPRDPFDYLEEGLSEDEEKGHNGYCKFPNCHIREETGFGRCNSSPPPLVN